MFLGFRSWGFRVFRVYDLGLGLGVCGWDRTSGL